MFESREARDGGLSKTAARRANLRDAFLVHPGLAGRLAGRHVALVDDVMTTGQTLMACAQALQLASPQAIHAVVFARAQSWAPTTQPPHVQPCPLPT